MRVPGVLAIVAVLLVAAGVAFWSARSRTPAPFVYLHGQLSDPGRGTDEVVFRMSGGKTFTLAQLRALPAVQYRATQPQLKRSVVYTGVPLRDLSEMAGLAGRSLRVEADDQFGATITPQDYETYPVMLAYLADGQPMTAAQKGPLQVVFPNEQYPRRFSNNGSQWVWFASGLGAAP